MGFRLITSLEEFFCFKICTQKIISDKLENIELVHVKISKNAKFKFIHVQYLILILFEILT